MTELPPPCEWMGLVSVIVCSSYHTDVLYVQVFMILVHLILFVHVRHAKT